MVSRSLPAALAVLVILLLPQAAARAAEDWVVRESSVAVPETVERLREAIVRSGSSVLAIFDHREAAQEVGLDLPESTVILFAKPKSVSPLIARSPRAAMDMPQRILVWAEDGATYAGFVSPSVLARRHGIEPSHPELRNLRAGLDALLDAGLKRRDERVEAGH